ncbi:MAG: hypothetical protein M1829_003857 [Trizodia sp. TS-e1964]|nr:MAG: hypothetical protein M1829_003857 [Trizodia sp. TS-e1964]
MDQLIDKVESFVANYMNQFDASHDYQHIQRVCSLARTIEAHERSTNPRTPYRSILITLASLLHDVGDRKYLKPGQDGASMAEEILVSYGADAALAKDVQTIVNHVSYSSEVRHPARVQACVAEYPELAVVQDADRLDALGAVGIGRCFAYNAAAGCGSMDVAIAHFHEKLEKVEQMMKTQLGREIAATRTRRLKEFRGWWEEEVAGADTGVSTKVRISAPSYYDRLN